MRQLILSFLIFSSLTSFRPAISKPVIETKPLRAENIFIPFGIAGKKISLLQLATIKPRELTIWTGKKLNFFQRLEFKSIQKKIKKSINKDGTVNASQSGVLDSESGFNVHGFLEGLAFGILGVLLIYLTSRNEEETLRHNRMKWAWIGCGISVLASIAILIALAAGA